MLWVVWLATGARVKPISPDRLGQLLSDLEAAGRREAHDLRDDRDPFVQRLGTLGAQFVYAAKAKAGSEGTVMVGPGTYGGFGWSGPTIDTWLDELLTSDQGHNKLGKLSRAAAAVTASRRRTRPV